ncbi:MAG TPA: acetate--CoA ligase family protein [Thermodesulfobacteriota bacterium]|nr:acetate--CoA ligase family protein [Thermodesulfobacteriota bacterium]
MTKQEAKKLITDAIQSGRTSLLEPEAKEILKAWEIPLPPNFVVKDKDAVIGAANNIGYPVVLKVVSRDILHKTEAGGVMAGLKNAQEVEDSFNEMIFELSDHYATAKIEGFLIERMVDKGVEVIVAGVRDAQFGPAVMFGIGGVIVELLKDVSFRLAPVTKEECLAMMEEIKAYPLLAGYRGAEPADLDAIADVIIKIGNIMAEAVDIKEMEINPLIVYPEGAMAVDARVVLIGKG